MKPHYEYIDRLKGVAILLVVILHLTIWFLYDAKGTLHNTILSFAMPLFMYLSGIVVSEVPDAKKLFGKLRRYWTPFLVVGLTFALCARLPILGFFTDSIKYGYWYLFALGLFYVLLFLIGKISSLFHRGKVYIDLFFLFAIPILDSIFSKTVSESWYNFLGLYHLRTFWPYFYGGFLVRKYHIINYADTHDWVYAVCLVVALPLMILSVVRNYYFSFPGCFAICFVLVLLLRRRNSCQTKITKELSRAGRNSLDAYIFHFFFLRLKGGLSFPSLGMWFRSTENYVLEFFVLLIIAIFIAYLSMGVGYIIRQSKILNKVFFGI